MLYSWVVINLSQEKKIGQRYKDTNKTIVIAKLSIIVKNWNKNLLKCLSALKS